MNNKVNDQCARRRMPASEVRAHLVITTASPLTPALSPAAGARGKPTYCQRSSLAPAAGERAGVRGELVVASRYVPEVLQQFLDPSW